jgi:hypothetical protein
MSYALSLCFLFLVACSLALDWLSESLICDEDARQFYADDSP